MWDEHLYKQLYDEFRKYVVEKKPSQDKSRTWAYDEFIVKLELCEILGCSLSPLLMAGDIVGYHHVQQSHYTRKQNDGEVEPIDKLIKINPLGRNILIMSYLLERSLVSLWSSFERYLHDVCSHIFRNKPQILKSSAMSLTTEELISKRSYDEIIDAIILKALFSLSSEGFFGYEDFFKKRLNIDFKIDLKKHYPKLDMIRTRRNEIIHHDGILTQENYQKLGYKDDKVGTKMLISLPYFCDSALTVLVCAKNIDIKIVEKFGTEFWQTDPLSETPR